MMIAKYKKHIALVSLIFLIVGLFLFVKPVAAQGATLYDNIGEFLGSLISLLISAIGLILTRVIRVLISVAQYSDFINAPAVINGWVVVRDICNMFFVVILLIIAFGTILQLPDYNYKKWLPKLIMMAVLINFSKTICGLLIDVAQVVMLTFVNAFKDVAGGNIVQMMGLKEIVTFAKSDSDIGFWAIVGSYVLGLIYITIALIVIVAMLAMLVMRIVMIWIYVVLSPLAYLLSAFPGGQSYAGQWWSEFTKNLVVGPVLAFFIWLAFVAMQGDGVPQGFISTDAAKSQTDLVGAGMGIAASQNDVSGSEASTPDVLMKFVISIGLLLGGMKIASSIGGEAAGMADKVFSKGKTIATAAGAWATIGAAKKAYTGEYYLGRKWSALTGMHAPAKIVAGFKASMEKSKKDDEKKADDISRARFERGGVKSVLLGAGVGQNYFDRYIQGFLGLKGIKRAGSDIFVAPGKRNKLGAEIDTIQEENKKLASSKKDLLSSDEKQDQLNQRIDNNLNSDQELSSISQKQANNAARLASLNKTNKQGMLTQSEKDELATLPKQQEELEKQAEQRRNIIKKETEKDFISSDADLSAIDLELSINDKKLKAAKEEIMKFQKPMAFEARSQYRKNVEEAKAKYRSITNADELLKALHDSETRGDKYEQIALIEKLASDANGNETLNSRGYDANAKGLRAYIFDEENGEGKKNGLKGKFSQEERLQMLNDVGELEERVGHWEMAKMVGMNSRGDLESLVKPVKDKNGDFVRNDKGRIVYDDLKHAEAAYAEVIKMDPQKIVNSLNRLALGGEDNEGKFQISNLGKMLFKFLGETGAFEKNEGRILGNTAANLTLEHIIPTLKELMEDDMTKFNRVIALLKLKGTTAEGSSLKANDMIDFLTKNKLT